MQFTWTNIKCNNFFFLIGTLNSLKFHFTFLCAIFYRNIYGWNFENSYDFDGNRLKNLLCKIKVEKLKKKKFRYKSELSLVTWVAITIRFFLIQWPEIFTLYIHDKIFLLLIRAKISFILTMHFSFRFDRVSGNCILLIFFNLI